MQDFSEQIEQYIPALSRYAQSLAKNPVAAEDLVQDCIVRALTKQELYHEGTNLRAWLFTILHNLHVNNMRTRNRWGIPVEIDSAIPALSEIPRQGSGLMIEALERGLGTLSSDQRTALMMIGVDGMSYEEAATKLNAPVGTVKSRVCRAREALRAAMEDMPPRQRRAAAEHQSAPSFAVRMARPRRVPEAVGTGVPGFAR